LIKKLYSRARRDLRFLEPYYSAHVAAMTAEKLHDKSDIAAEFAARDQEIAQLRHVLSVLAEHDPSWSDDFLRARAALIGAEATLAGDTVSGLKEPESAP
jgi:hypothetical protein